MTFDDFLIWIEERMKSLRPKRVPRERRKHLQRLCRTLVDAACYDPVRWYEVAQKIAAHLGEPAPEMPDGAPTASGRQCAHNAAGPGPSKAAVQSQRFQRPGKKNQSSSVPRRRAIAARHEPIQMNAELEAAFAAVAAGKPIVFVTGGAGTGKSTFIRALRERFRDRSTVVLAPTGVAALTAGGQTIHSFCRLPLRPVTAEDIRKIDEPEERGVVEKLDLLIIDEISMVRADILDGLELFLRINRESAKPFGGVQVVFVGDLFQLPPVVTRDDQPFLFQRYESPYFFGALCLRGLSFAPVELQIVYRQSDDRFKALLRNLRDGEVGGAVAEINRLCVGRKLSDPYIMLVPTRKAAAAENEIRLAALPGKESTYVATSDGTFRTRSEDSLPAPARLMLKKRAQVMFTRNDSEKRWVNGTLGTVDQLRKDSITVRLDGGDVHDVDIVEWQDIHYTFDQATQSIVEEIAGNFAQFPLIPAWAVTIHKAQGLTLSRVAVDLGRGAFAEGQVYVALSRCQTVEGLSLARPVRANEVRCSEAARTFYAKMRRRLPQPHAVSEP